MFKGRTVVTSLFATFLLLQSAYSSAQLVVDIADCRSIEDRLERFNCYENLDASTSSVDAASVTNTTNPNTTTIQADEKARSSFFGLRNLFKGDTERQQPETIETVEQPGNQVTTTTQSVVEFGRTEETDNARVIEGTDGKTELLDTIAELEQLMPNLWLVTLSSGQQWRQMTNKRYPVKLGDEVRIYPTIWGNDYRMTATRLSGYIQVKRVD